MEKGYLNKNIVFIGDFKPSKFDKFYFIKNQLLNEDDFLEGSVFLPDIAVIDTGNYLIEVNHNRFSINFKIVDSKIDFEKLILVLKDSNVRAFGFNFKRALFLNNVSDTKRFFYFEKNILNSHFDTENSAYGYYVSRDFEGSRLKLDMKPVQLQKVDENLLVDALDFSFNFHFESANFEEKLSDFNSFEELSLEIINSYE